MAVRPYMGEEGDKNIDSRLGTAIALLGSNSALWLTTDRTTGQRWQNDTAVQT